MDRPQVSGVDPSKYPVPIETVYVNKLEERVKIDTLKEALHGVFSHYGTIIDIIAKTSLKRKGQAFIVFDSQKSALAAVEEMSGFEMYGKVMNVTLAKTHSDATLKRKATAEQFEQHKRERLTAKERKVAEEASKAENAPATADKPRPKPGAAIPDEYVRPNKILFLQNIPKDATVEELAAVFERFDGFMEVRVVNIRNIAFAEFENEQNAITAKEATANMPMGPEGKPMKVTYQRQENKQASRAPAPAVPKVPKVPNESDSTAKTSKNGRYYRRKGYHKR